ncbi:putative NADH-flavin reductase [Actinoplanes tereljensis]
MTTSIAVFGAGGRAGRHIVAEATARGHRVVAVVRDPTRHPGLTARNVAVVPGDTHDAAHHPGLTAPDPSGVPGDSHDPAHHPRPTAPGPSGVPGDSHDPAHHPRPTAPGPSGVRGDTRDPARQSGLGASNVSVVAGDARDPASVADAAAGCAAVVSAVTPFSAPPASFDGFDTGWYAQVADALLAAKPARLIVVGLFATLRTRPDGPRVLDDPALFPVALRPFALAHAAGLQRLAESDADWLLLAPPPGLSTEASPTGTYRLGDDTAEEQSSPLAYADLARAVIDQIERPTRRRQQVAIHAA